MRVLITGGTRGIGKGLTDIFCANHLVLALDSSMNIECIESRNKILIEADRFDVFINNAYGNGSGQRDLMLEYFDKYSNENKIFVNIESVNAWRSGFTNQNQIRYATDKLALVTARRALQKMPRKMKIIGICPGITDTEYNHDKPVDKISVESLSKIVYNNIILIKDGIEISEIHVNPC